jgi:ADP-ribosyl-[dinitrogen reductase] hydrolase
MIISDRARACLLGAAVGDACGAPLENMASVSHEDAERALCFPGGGPHGVGRGQFTDDTETLICLYSALKASPPFAGYPADAVANNLCEWYGSGPFDCGRTCALAFDAGRGQPVKTAAKMRDDARLFNMDSQSNGALMRAAAIPVWGVSMGMTVLEIAEVARQDATLSHPSPQCVEANAAYCAALAHLLRAPADSERALQAANLVCRHADVAAWLALADPGDVVQHGGHVKHALALTAKHLRARTPFRDAMYDVLRRGGDVDTNAAIVGAAMGALHGEIPADLLTPVVNFDAAQRRRPEWLSVKRLVE